MAPGPARAAAPVLRAEPRYELRGRLGSGGMGIVHTAWDRPLRREVAVKCLRPELVADAVVREQFTEEAVILAGLDHPGAVPVHETGELPDGTPFCAMKRLRGVTLGDLLRERGAGALASREDLAHLVGIFEKVCQTVAAAHGRGIVHRDLKPDNVMVDDLGAVYVMDWGLAFSSSPEGAASVAAPVPGEIAGTPGYMAPEQARGSAVEIGPRSDVFALGTILYEILTGRNPFRGGTAQDALKSVQQLDPPPASRVNPRAGRVLSAVCRKAMSRDAARRYADARELADEILRYREFRPVAAAPPTALERLANWARRKPALAGSALTVVALSLLVGAARGYRAFDKRAEVERTLVATETLVAEAAAISSRLVDARRAAEAAPPGAEGEEARARAVSLEEQLGVVKGRVKLYAVAVLVFTVDRPDPRARAIYRAELRDEVSEALRAGRATRVAALVDEALREAAARNLPGWSDSDLAWLRARREEARASRAAGGAS